MARLLERRSSRQAIRKSRSNLSIGIAVVAVLLGVELCNAQTSPGDTACAAREITLAMFVEAHGTGPDSASVILDDNAVALMSAVPPAITDPSPALAIYDRLIGELAASLKTQK
jgi:hypothetical protein